MEDDNKLPNEAGHRPLSKIADRIRKFLALAQSENENEAKAALAQAQKLMLAHKLSEADVAEVGPDENDIVEESLGSDGFSASWKFALVSCVARGFFCDVVALASKTRRSRLARIFGRAEDVEAAKAAFEWILKEALRLSEEELGTRAAVNAIERCLVTRNEYRSQFLIGVALGVGVRLKEGMTKFSESSSKALAVVDKTKERIEMEMEKKFGKSKTAEVKVTPGMLASAIRDRGQALGYEAAGSIERKTADEPKPRPLQASPQKSS